MRAIFREYTLSVGFAATSPKKGGGKALSSSVGAIHESPVISKKRAIFRGVGAPPPTVDIVFVGATIGRP